jgi:hypothetical protein
MALAMIYPEPRRGMHSLLRDSTGIGFDKALLSHARAVPRHSQALAEDAPRERVEESATVFSAKRLQQARTILNQSRALAGGARAWPQTRSFRAGFPGSVWIWPAP